MATWRSSGDGANAGIVRRTVVLVGLPGSGKSTVGALAAGLFGVPFVDLDDVIESEAGKSVARIFAEEGEAAFRSLEARTGADVLAGPPCVLAPGGGFLLDPVTRRLVAGSALTIYLVTSPAVAARRLAPSRNRPLLAGGDPEELLARLLDQRDVVYRESEQQVITDDLTPEAAAVAVAKLAREDQAL
jgi:shikimate kinase